MTIKILNPGKHCMLTDNDEQSSMPSVEAAVKRQWMKPYVYGESLGFSVVGNRDFQILLHQVFRSVVNSL